MSEFKTLPLAPQQSEPRKVTGVTEARISAQADKEEAVAEVMAEQALQDALRRKRRQATRYDVKLEGRESSTLELSPSISGEVTDIARRLNAFGTPSPGFATHMLGQIATAARGQGQHVPRSLQLNAALAAMERMEPENEAQALLAVQMVATHTAAIGMLSRMTQAADTSTQQETANLAIKLLRTYTSQTEAMAKLQRGGEQKVRVEHVHVYPGGKAVVGDVTVNGASDEFGESPQRGEGLGQLKPRLTTRSNSGG